MAYGKARIPTEVYHLTRRENVDSIRADKRIRRFGDTECWFCWSPEDMLRYMEYTVLCEGKPYIATDGRIEHYPEFIPEDHVLLKLLTSNSPRRSSGLRAGSRHLVLPENWQHRSSVRHSQKLIL